MRETVVSDKLICSDFLKQTAELFIDLWFYLLEQSFLEQVSVMLTGGLSF